ncbi:LLM class flavin-dependent oxidoreductase [Ornithinimicrobium sp. F0845]|uniref:LLM class flavin-dependent oxidoreductase n=1 Tax=Ornithinimicrobium sp. F0845 TaxID=2926412 RepID=UPI001FF2A3CC|nr:LLM class flavin-dependent oxidoreductase [Ornithinimicrobium sp. F0845]MCK0112673.1 LLM class flavin-dependent oxidoreductase [Ornithinimicrobium sp. F0845]
MTRVGAVFSPYDNAPEALRDAVAVCEAEGVPELWLWEDCFRESAYASVAAALAWSTELRVGLGISPFPLRNVTVTAMEIATIEWMFPGRFYPGLGHGVLPWMEQAGVRAASPLTLMREYLPALRSLLAGEEVTTSGRYVTLDRVRLDWPPETPPPIYSAGEGPKTLALTGEIADGTILVGGLTPAEISERIELVRQGQAAANHAEATTIVAYVTAAFGDGAEDRVRAELAQSGIDVDDRGFWGDPEDVALALRRFADAGADALILQPPTGEPDLHGFLRAVAEVARLLA